MNYKKNIWHAYDSSSTLAGTGDHPAEGGKVVKGISGNIHVMSGVESDIMKVHGPEGERILAQRQNKNIDDIRTDRNTGYKAYGIFGPSNTDKQADTLEQMFQIGVSDIRTGTETMFDFMDTTLQQQLQQFGYEQDILDIQGKGYDIQGRRLDIKEESLVADTRNIRRDMEKYGGGGQQEVRTGLQTGDDSIAIEKLEETGTAGMETIGRTREDIALGREEIELGMDTLAVRGNILEGKVETAETQAEIDKYNYSTAAGQQLANMMTQYMTATGEDIPDEFMSTYEEYMETYG